MSTLLDYLNEAAVIGAGWVVGVLLANQLLRIFSDSGPEWLTRRRKVVLCGAVVVLLGVLGVNQNIGGLTEQPASLRAFGFTTFFAVIWLDLGTISLISLLARIRGRWMDRAFPAFRAGLETLEEEQGTSLLVSWKGWWKSRKLRAWVAAHMDPDELEHRANLSTDEERRAGTALALLEYHGFNGRARKQLWARKQLLDHGDTITDLLTPETTRKLLADTDPQIREWALRSVGVAR